MKKNLTFLIFTAITILCGCNKQLPESYDSMQGIIINEVSPCPSIGKEGWIEIYNGSDKKINLKGMQVILTDNLVTEEKVATLKEGVIEPSGYYVISTLNVGFSASFLRSNLIEVSVADAEGALLNSFSLQYDFTVATRPASGESYARVPDVSGDWVITGNPTPGAANYKIIKYTLSNIIINEVCPAGKWVEIANTGTRDMQLDYSYFKDGDGDAVYTFPFGTKLGGGERTAADFESEIPVSFTFCDNSGAKVGTFSSASLAEPAEGGSWSRLPDLTGDWKLSSIATKGTANVSVTGKEEGLVINEVSLAGWVEICNSTLETITTSGITLKSGNVKVYESGAVSIAAKEKIVASVSVTASTELSLYGSDGTLLSQFKPADVRSDSRTATTSTSWSRLPDGTGKWFTVFTPSKGSDNYGIEADNTIGLWVNHSSMGSIDLEEICKKGIGNIIIHEYVFRTDYHKRSDVTAFFDKAHSLGMKVHIWMQCFKWNDSDWVRPVNADGSWNQTAFDEIINRGLPYLDYDIDGIHFDYVRFSGAGTNQASKWTNGTEGITEFCRQASVKMKAKKPELLLSAALMGEAGCVSYYGQDPAKMSQYIDILMPMAYISSFGYSDSRNITVADWFADRCQSGNCWHGISTYNSNTVGLSAEQIYHDCENITASHANGVALFRYGIGTLPNLTGMYAK